MVGSRPLSPSSCKCTYSVSNLGLSKLVKLLSFDPNKIGTENQRGIGKNINILVDNVYEWIR